MSITRLKWHPLLAVFLAGTAFLHAAAKFAYGDIDMARLTQPRLQTTSQTVSHTVLTPEFQITANDRVTLIPTFQNRMLAAQKLTPFTGP